MGNGSNIVSASEVLSYRGDAALGGGYDPRISPILTGDPTGGLDKMLHRLTEQNFRFNLRQYDQEIKDRDESLAMLSDPTNNIDFDVMDQDRPELERMRDEISAQWLKNPDIQSDPKQYVELQQKIKEFKQAANSAKSRSLEHTKQIGLIANEPNAVIRQQRINHLNEQIGKGLNHKIDPYFNNYQYDRAKMFPVLQQEQIGSPTPMVVDGDAYLQQTVGVRPEVIKNRFEPANLLASENSNLRQDVQLMYEDFIRSPYVQDEDFIQRVNEVTDKINKDWGYSKDDSGYFEPAFVKEGDEWKVTDKPYVLAQALYAKDQYRFQTTRQLSADYQKQLKTKADTALAKANTWKAYATGKALSNKYNAEAKRAEEQGDQTKARTALLKSAASQQISESIGTFYNINDAKGFNLVKDLFDKSGGAETLSGQYLKAAMGSVGIDESWSYSVVPNTNEGAVKMLSVPKIGEKGKKTDVVVKPTTIYALKSPDGDLNKMKLVGLDRNGKIIKTVNPEQGIDELIKYESGYNQSSQTVKIQGAARLLVTEMQGSEAQGLDLNAILDSNGVIDVTPENLSNYDEVKELEGVMYYRKGDVWHDEDGNPIE